MAEDEGFEPPQTESESGVLPLHKSSIQEPYVLYPLFRICQYKNARCSGCILTLQLAETQEIELLDKYRKRRVPPFLRSCSTPVRLAF